ncbi:HAD-IA family hydrolase [Candidatus Dependentiae bacterium]|nr:HAD-IA family hydrolase [Candidatus Dependentiae bacterium]
MTKFNFIKILLFSSFIFFCECNCKIKAVVFDLGGVLCQTDKVAFAKEIFNAKDIINLGFTSIISSDFAIWNFQERVLSLMSEMEPQICGDNGFIAKYEKSELPEIMCKWFRGELSGRNVYKQVKRYFLEQYIKNPQKFKNKADFNILNRIIKNMFDQQKLSENTKLISDMLDILKELKKQNYELFILSNWSKDSFEIFYNSEHAQEIFELFKSDHIFVSGITGFMKPANSAYQNLLGYAFAKYGIQPEECVMIDDQPENIEAATKFCGMHGILFDQDFTKFRSELEKFNILQQQPKGWMQYIWS